MLNADLSNSCVAFMFANKQDPHYLHKDMDMNELSPQMAVQLANAAYQIKQADSQGS